jgi:hypothetical protein
MGLNRGAGPDDAAARFGKHGRVVVDFCAFAATLRRDISSQTGQPMEIFGGTYEESQIAPRAEWLR